MAKIRICPSNNDNCSHCSLQLRIIFISISLSLTIEIIMRENVKKIAFLAMTDPSPELLADIGGGRGPPPT